MRRYGVLRSVVLAAAFWSGCSLDNAAVAAPATQAQAEKTRAALVPHKATYRLSLVKALPSDGVRAAQGTMTYTLADRCDGYTIESNVSMNLVFVAGNVREVDQLYAAWEAKDGSFSSFSMQTRENGKPASSYRGTITLRPDGSGTATYDGNTTTQFDLAAGTMLSTAHTAALLDNAKAGKRFFRGQVIDGAFEHGPLLVAASIARRRDSKILFDNDELRSLSGGPMWPTNLAYFPADSSATLPDYQLNMELLPSGVARSMTQDFGQFMIGFTLVGIEALDKPDC